MKIAIVGGGIFGIMSAIKLAKEHDVFLFEKNDDILKAASNVNQCRIHRGYHYPRSDETTIQTSKSHDSFLEEFSESIISGIDNYYCISKFDSYTKSKEYVKFCKRHNLEFTKVNLDLVDKNSIDICLKVKEYLFDHEILKKKCWEKLDKSGVTVYLNTIADYEIYEKYDFIIISTYANVNSLLKKYPEKQRDYQFEIVEKIFLELPLEFKNKSVVIMDGHFLSIDPVGTKNYFIIGDVVNTVHSRNIGKFPKIDAKFIPLLDKGLIKNPPFTNLNLFLKSGSRFFPKFNEAKYIGSSFCVKTVLPEVDSTDARLTLVEMIDKKIITIFSGKISTCIDAANQVEKLIKARK
jgi:hypothetical protein|tara:strand:- start:336 stop:1388 length:1053 start_codon:yes stop_codon:yes gene_type:complete